MDDQVRYLRLPAMLAFVHSVPERVSIVVLLDWNSMPEETRALVVLFRHEVHADGGVCHDVAPVRLHNCLVHRMAMLARSAECRQGTWMDVERVARVELLHELEPARKRKEICSAFSR